MFYNVIDDGNLSAPFTKMTEAIDYVFDEGPEVGYHLKNTKGVYLLGRCEDRVDIGYKYLTEALRRRMVLITRFDFDPALIRIHLHNGGDKLIYGAKVLGRVRSWEATWGRSWQNSRMRPMQSQK